jgi:hypothetical protein
MNEQDAQRRLAREARETFLGTLGDRSGINVARVEVTWFYDNFSVAGPIGFAGVEEHSGHYCVHATGEEPEAQGEDGSIYTVFEDLVHAAMLERQKRLGFAGYEIDDISSW